MGIDALVATLWPVRNNTITGLDYSASGGTEGYYFNNTGAPLTLSVSATFRMLIAANTTSYFKYFIRNRLDGAGSFIDDLAWDYQTTPSNPAQREHTGTVNAIFTMVPGGRFGILFQSNINSGAGSPSLQGSRLNVTRIVT
jgi:hypothetical protein